jgi:hypothetical protein
MVQAALDVFQMDLQVVRNDIATGVTGAPLRQAIQDLDAALVDLVRAEIRFAVDSRADGAHCQHGDGDGADLKGLDDFFADLASLARDLI